MSRDFLDLDIVVACSWLRRLDKSALSWISSFDVLNRLLGFTTVRRYLISSGAKDQKIGCEAVYFNCIFSIFKRLNLAFALF